MALSKKDLIKKIEERLQTINELDEVILIEDLPEENLKAGTKGLVVDVFGMESLSWSNLAILKTQIFQ